MACNMLNEYKNYRNNSSGGVISVISVFHGISVNLYTVASIQNKVGFL